MRVLVAEDDQRTADYLVRGLTESGHIVDRVADGERWRSERFTMPLSSIGNCRVSTALPSFARDRTVDMHIHRLRQKIDDGFECRLIHTVTGAGYTVRAATRKVGQAAD